MSSHLFIGITSARIKLLQNHERIETHVIFPRGPAGDVTTDNVTSTGFLLRSPIFLEHDLANHFFLNIIS